MKCTQTKGVCCEQPLCGSISTEPFANLVHNVGSRIQAFLITYRRCDIDSDLGDWQQLVGRISSISTGGHRYHGDALYFLHIDVDVCAYELSSAGGIRSNSIRCGKSTFNFRVAFSLRALVAGSCLSLRNGASL